MSLVSFKMNKILFFFIKFFICIITLYYVFQYSKLSISDFFELFIFNPNLLLIIICFFIYYILSVYRWFAILRQFNHSIKFFDCLKIDASSIIFNFLLPTGELAGETARAYLIYKKNIKKQIAVSSVLLDRLFGMIALLILSFPSFFYLYFIKFEFSWLFSIIIFFFILLLLFFLKKLLNYFIVKFEFKNHFTIILKVITNSKYLIFISSLSFIFLYLLIILGGDINFENLDLLIKTMIIFPLGLIAMSIPISPSGIGIGSLAYLALFDFFFSETNMVMVHGVLIYQLLFFCFGILIFFINSIFFKYNCLKKNEL